MRKILLSIVAAFMMLSTASAQLDLRILNHLSVGAEVGTLASTPRLVSIKRILRLIEYLLEARH